MKAGASHMVIDGGVKKRPIGEQQSLEVNSAIGFGLDDA